MLLLLGLCCIVDLRLSIAPRQPPRPPLGKQNSLFFLPSFTERRLKNCTRSQGTSAVWCELAPLFKKVLYARVQLFDATGVLEFHFALQLRGKQERQSQLTCRGRQVSTMQLQHCTVQLLCSQPNPCVWILHSFRRQPLRVPSLSSLSYSSCCFGR